MRVPNTPTIGCDVCGKTTSRLMGFAAVITLRLADGTKASRFQSSARGFCRAHREEIPARFLADVKAEGEVVWQAPEPAMLRPGNLPSFSRDMDELSLEIVEALGGAPADAQHHIFTSDALREGAPPKACMHCGGRLSWGTGPHVKDALKRQGRADPWECLDCGAAGILVYEE